MILRAALALRGAIAAPIQMANLQRRAEQGQAPISILFYHRVADSSPNAWTIRRDSFRRQMDYVSERMEWIDLAEAQRRVADSHSPSPAVALTFDDGYADNSDFALPYLIEQGIPCTYFVTTSHVRNGLPFPHDVAAGRPLGVNSVQQIRDAANAGIEIGCHTRTHIDFSQVIRRDVLVDEIADAKDELEQMIGKAVRYFAFPYGMPAQLTQAAIEVVHEAGFLGFCSAYGAYNLPGGDSFHLRRCHGDPEFSRFKNWLSFDPRKQKAAPSIRYRLPDGPSPSLAPVATGCPLAIPALDVNAPMSEATESWG